MIIVDFQGVLIATLYAQLGAHVNAPLDENMLRHMALNCLRSYKVKFKDAGEMVIACDTRHSWRKDVFAYYKANRAKVRSESGLDWKTVFEFFETMRSDLREYFPYRVIEVDGAEADDIIGVLAHKFGKDDEFGGLKLASDAKEQIVIISRDHDFKQLHIHDNVKQWDPISKKFIKVPNATLYLKTHIIRGDTGDGVPNLLSDDDTLVVPGKRQKAIFERKLDEWLKQDPQDFCGSDIMRRNWKRNEQMVDLKHTPERIKDEILSQYHSQAGKNKSRLESYFIKNRLKNLHPFYNEF